jgi:hypothetical protein
MREILALTAILVFSTAARSATVVCAEDANTNRTMCFPQAPMRVSSDKIVREAALYSGGPRGTTANGHTVRVFCSKKLVPVMEMRDRKGVVYFRNQPDAKIGRDFAQFMCDHTPTKTDKALDEVPRF